MRVTLDENLGTRTARLFLSNGHDVATVHDQATGGATDTQLYADCIEEDRALVTLDLDCANPFRFDPSKALPVLRVSNTPGITEPETVVARLLAVLASEQIRGRLWVVDLIRVREYRPPDPATGE